MDPPDGERLMETVDLLGRAVSLVEIGTERGITVRLMGGLAFRAKVPAWPGRPSAAQPDIDLVTTHEARSSLTELLVEAGYRPDRQHNVLYGDRQLFFLHPEAGHAVDVVIDRLVMCHTLDLRRRMELDSPTLTSADLLLSKLQIVRFNRKDALDVLALLSAYPLTDGDADGISLPRILAYTSADWGWWRTVTGNLELLGQIVESDLRPAEVTAPGEDLSGVTARLARMSSAIEAAPKSLAWHLRGRIGERLQWYDEPEEVRHAT
jgi:hypothetical protein